MRNQLQCDYMIITIIVITTTIISNIINVLPLSKNKIN